MSAKGILVLECPWSDRIDEPKTVRPFIEGWAHLCEFPFSYRMYYDSATLSHWIRTFVMDDRLTVCYIAGHGKGGRLTGLLKNINLPSLANVVRNNPKGSGRPGKGILFGACDIGSSLEDFLNQCGRSIQWVAGYNKTVPWMESTVCDLLFLDYVLNGRIRRDNGLIAQGDTDKFSVQSTRSMQKIRDWVYQDMSLAQLLGFDVYESPHPARHAAGSKKDR